MSSRWQLSSIKKLGNVLTIVQMLHMLGQPLALDHAMKPQNFLRVLVGNCNPVITYTLPPSLLHLTTTIPLTVHPYTTLHGEPALIKHNHLIEY